MMVQFVANLTGQKNQLQSSPGVSGVWPALRGLQPVFIHYYKYDSSTKQLVSQLKI